MECQSWIKLKVLCSLAFVPLSNLATQTDSTSTTLTIGYLNPIFFKTEYNQYISFNYGSSAMISTSYKGFALSLGWNRVSANSSSKYRENRDINLGYRENYNIIRNSIVLLGDVKVLRQLQRNFHFTFGTELSELTRIITYNRFGNGDEQKINKTEKQPGYGAALRLGVYKAINLSKSKKFKLSFGIYVNYFIVRDYLLKDYRCDDLNGNVPGVTCIPKFNPPLISRFNLIPFVNMSCLLGK